MQYKMETSTCRDCDSVKSLDEFHPLNKSCCKICFNQRRKKQYTLKKTVNEMLDIDHVNTKQCKTCEKEKLLMHFYKSGDHRDGYFNVCKQCVNQKQRHQYAAMKGIIKRTRKPGKKQQPVDSKARRIRDLQKLSEMKENIKVSPALEEKITKFFADVAVRLAK